MSRKKYLKILELGENANSEEIEKAYKELVRVWHPDRFQTDPALIAKAEEKTRELNLAFAELKKYNNYKAKAEPEVSETELKQYFETLKKEAKGKNSYSGLIKFILAAVIFYYVGSRFNFLSTIFNKSPETIRIEQDDFLTLRQSIGLSAKNKVNTYRSVNEPEMTRLEDGTATIKPPFLKAAVDCRTEDVRSLMEQGHDVNEHDEEGNTALIWASRQGCQETVKFLISKGANINQKSTNGFSPLMWATLYKRDVVVSDLLSAGSEPLPKFWDKTKKYN